MAADPAVVWNAAGQLLAAVSSRHGGTLPSRQLITPGAPAWDCQLVAVWCEGTAGYTGSPGTITTEHRQPAAGFAMRSATFVVTILRPVPVCEGIPSRLDVEDAAELLYTDATRTINALLAAAKDQELPGCHSMAFLGWRVVGPEGGLVAGELRVTIGLVRGA